MIDYSQRNIRTWSRLGSCGALGVAANELPLVDERVVFLTADLTFYSGLNGFNSVYPDRLYNCGIAEQNMVGIAAGLAKEGFIPFATTYATFASMRCADQVRVNMGYMNLPIKLVGLTAGLSVGILGATHISTEDIAVMRTIPNLTILSPADCTATIKAALAAATVNGPVYLRLSGVMGNPIVYNEDFEFQIGRAITVKKESQSDVDITIVATGTMVYNSLQAAEKLEADGLSVRVLDMHTIKPLDQSAVLEATQARLIVSVEEHSIIGGLGAAVAETMSPMETKPPLLILGIQDDYGHAADYACLIDRNSLSADHIYDNIKAKFKEISK